MDIQEALQRTLKTAQAPCHNNRSWQTIPVPYDSDKKKILWITLLCKIMSLAVFIRHESKNAEEFKTILQTGL